MEETKNIIRLAVVLTILAALMLVLFQGLTASKNAADISYRWITGVVRNSKPSMTEIVDAASERALPITAIASIVSNSKNKIITFECLICGSVTSGYELGECLYTHPKGRGSLTFIELGNDEYAVILEHAT